MDEANYIRSLYKNILLRDPGTSELTFWLGELSEHGYVNLIERFFRSEEYRGRFHPENLPYKPGHFYSPITDPGQLNVETFRRRLVDETSSLLGVNVTDDSLIRYWDLLSKSINSCPFPEEPSTSFRYYWKNGVYEFGDSAVTFSMMNLMSPKQVVEVGSGFSSACMLDSAEFWGLNTKFTFIDPYPNRVLGLLKPEDNTRVKVISDIVQNTNLQIYRSLERNDILFIDSSHVSKALSDVNFEIFEILPNLQAGVVIHFHDIFFPFEYPIDWIFHHGLSWNEAYVIRAFLMYNYAFEVLFFNHAFSLKNAARVSSDLNSISADRFLKNPGGGLWLRKL